MASADIRDFYLGRIKFAMGGSFTQREEILRMVARTAFRDYSLTNADYVVILDNVQEAHKKSMEMMRNEVWNGEHI